MYIHDLILKHNIDDTSQHTMAYTFPDFYTFPYLLGRCILAMACDGCTNNLYTTLTIFQTFDTSLAFFQAHKVLHEQVDCPSCHQPASFNIKGLKWRCQKTRLEDGVKLRCNFTQALSKSTCLEETHSNITTIGQIMTYFLYLAPPHQAFITSELQISRQSVVTWSHFIRQAELEWCPANTSQTLGGPNTVVEVDEAKFGHQKYNRGRVPQDQWVLGGVQRGTNNIFLKVVQERDQATLMDLPSNTTRNHYYHRWVEGLRSYCS